MKSFLRSVFLVSIFAICSTVSASESKSRISKRDEILRYLRGGHTQAAIDNGMNLARDVVANKANADKNIRAVFKDPNERIMLYALIGDIPMDKVFVPARVCIPTQTAPTDWVKLDREAKLAAKRLVARESWNTYIEVAPRAICEAIAEKTGEHFVKSFFGL